MEFAPILIIGAEPSSLVNFRGDLCKALVQSGARVVAASAPATPAIKSALAAIGVEHVDIPLKRASLNPLDDLRTARALYRLFRTLQPSLVLAYTIKPVIWSGIALRRIPGPRFFALITGLGYGFEGRSLRRLILTFAIAKLYRAALTRAQKVIFQNPDNRQAFLNRNILEAAKCHLVNGSGVNLARFEFSQLPETGTVFLSIARLLGDKGLREYADAASRLRRLRPDVECHLVGPLDPSPDGIPLAEVESWQRDGAIIYHGGQADVRPFIERCHIYVLPSYHEGLPRTVIEAMAMGRPILTTDVPGCRETVLHSENGFLVPKADVDSLADRMIWFAENRAAWPRMAAASRRLAQDRFDVDKVNREMLRIMGLSYPPIRS